MGQPRSLGAQSGKRRNSAVQEAVRTLNGIFRDVDLFSRRSLMQYGSTGPQIWALRVLRRAGTISMGDLAGSLFLHVSTVTGIVDRLEKRRLLARRRSDTDNRVVLVRPTWAGRRLAGRAPEPPRSILARAMSRLPLRQVEEIRRGLRVVAELMRSPSPVRHGARGDGRRAGKP